MRKMMLTIVLFGLSLSNAFADDGNSGPSIVPTVDIRYECSFRGEGKGALKCRIEGLLCEEQFPTLGTLGKLEECRNGDDPVRIRCSDGFELFDEDAHVDDEGEDLFIRANSHKNKKIAEILIRDVFENSTALTNNNGEKFDAEIIVSEDVGHAARLEGRCEIELNDPREEVM